MREDFEFRNSALMNLYPQIVSMRDVETENESFLDSSGNEIVIDNKKVEEEILKLKALKPMQLLRAERNIKLKEEVDPKTCEAYNNGTQLSTEWKNYRQALLDMTRQTPTLDENGNLKAGLELDEIYWPTKPE